MKNWLLTGAVVVIVLVAAAACVSWSLLHDGVSARATPSLLETIMARDARLMAIPEKARAMHNPLTANAENLREARLHFADHCAVCHANDGSGDTMMGNGMYPKPPDLRAPQTQNLSDGDLFWVIENGVRFTGMPAFGGTPSSEDDSWRLVLFLRHLPQLSAEERIEMEKYNPKGPEERVEEQEEYEFLNGAQAPAKAEKAQHH